MQTNINYYVVVPIAFLMLAMGASLFSFKIEPNTVYAETKVAVLVHEAAVIPPVLQRIKGCESGGNQFKNGQVLISINKNGTYDQGEYQINSIHNKDAATRGYDLATEAGNEGYAVYLYQTFGTPDWSASYACWGKAK